MNKTEQNRTLIIYKDADSTSGELCRVWDPMVIPQKGDLVNLTTFDLYGGKELPHLENLLWKVTGRTITQDVLYIYVTNTNNKDI